MKSSEFNDFLKENILVIDGAMGTMIQNYNFDAAVYGGEKFQMLSDLLVFSRPGAIKDVHLKYYQAGSNAVETNTFGASLLRLDEFNFSELDLKEYPPQADGADLSKISLEDFSYRLNRQAAEIANQALTEYKKDSAYDGRPLYVIGSIGPSNWVLSSTHADLNKGTFKQIEDNFYQQVLGLVDGGVDILLFETQQDVLELKAAVFGAKKAMKEKGVDLPIMAQVTVDQFSKMQIFNTDIQAALTTIQDIGVNSFGINCSIGPDLMLPTVQKLSKYSKIPISIIPNAGLPESENGQTVFKLPPEELAEHLKTYIEEYGVNIVGGCCGTSPAHIKAVAEMASNITPKERDIDNSLYISGPQNAIIVDGSESLIRIGERLNVRGSKKVREAVENIDNIDDDALEEVVSEQVRDLGVSIIDVCMDSNVVNTPETLVKVIQSQTMDLSAAMCIDSFDVKALEEAIKVYPGRPIINSISLEEYAEGVDKIDAVLSVTYQHSPLYIALTADSKGPATTAEGKRDLAKRIYDKTTEKYGVKPSQLLFDINAFPIGSESDPDMNFALESIKSIPMIKALHPDVKTTIGVGNLTNGLAKKPYMRKVLTSVFLDEARKVGLDAAIINPNHYVPVDSLPEGDYQIGLDIVLKHDMDAFARLEEIAEQKKGGPVKKKVSYDDLEPIVAICEKIKNGYKEREKGKVTVQGTDFEYSDKIVLQVIEVIKEVEPLTLINDHLMVSMEELGDGFADGTVSLPHLLKSADVMKQVMTFLEKYMKSGQGEDSEEIKSKGTIVLGTVYQDVHSIGKDLCKTLYENYGFKVIDLGVQVPLQNFIDEAIANQADAIGLSALLVQTSNHMITLSKMLKEANLEHIPVFIGGAPVNLRHAAYVAMAGEENEDEIRDNVFYCNSAMDGVNYMNQLMEPSKRDAFLKENKEKLIEAFQRGQRREKSADQLQSELTKRTVLHTQETADPEHYLPVQKLEMSMREFLPYLNKDVLFSLNWKFGGKGSWEKKGVTRESLEALLEEWVEKVDSKGWLKAQAMYGLFPCIGGEESVQVLDPKTKKEIGTFEFNDAVGEGKKDKFNIANYFSPEGKSLIGVQISTGSILSAEAIKMLPDDDQETAWFLQGLADRVAEDMAARVNIILDQKVFGNQEKRSHRYSPGYPAMKPLKNNGIILDILGAKEALGIQLTEGDEFSPTSTTGAVVCFHPEADYR